jgi:hypothetical protein
MTTPVVRESDLGTLEEFRDGGYGVVYRLPDFRLPDVSAALLFKKFKADTLSKGRVESLKLAVEWRAELSPRRRALLDSLAAWTVRLVVDSRRRVIGVIMPEAPDEYFYDFTPGVAGSATKRNPVEISSLIPPAHLAQLQGIPCPDDDDLVPRLLVAARVALFFSFLHDNGIVYGDLSPSNVLVDFRQHPSIQMIDCDAVHFERVKETSGQNGSPFWQSPEEKALGPLTRKTDVYKLSLLILRIVATRAGAAQIIKPEYAQDALGDAGVTILREGLDPNPDTRVITAGRFYDYLVEEIDSRIEMPEISRLELGERYVVEGGSAQILLSVEHADRVTIRTPDGREIPVPPTEWTGSMRVDVLRPGAFEVSATNRFGTVTRATDILHVLHPPQLVTVRVPEPTMPSIDGAHFHLLRQGLDSAEVTSAQLTTPIDQLRQMETEAALHQGIFGPNARPADGLQFPDVLRDLLNAPFAFAMPPGLKDHEESAATPRRTR